MPNSLNNGDSVYRMLFDSAGDAIFVHTENKILAVNRKACEMLGYTEDELLSMRPNEVNAIEHRVYMPEHMAKLKKRKLISFETIHQKKDGTQVPVEITARAITWNGETAVMSICRDNSTKNHYDNAVLAAALEWQNTFDAFDDAVFLLSPDDRILRCNKASYRMFNKAKPGEILGKFCWEVVHGTSKPLPSCPIIIMRKTKKREIAVLKSGELWLEVTVDPVLDGNNNISGAVHVVSDITERKQVEMELMMYRDHLEEIAGERSFALKESEKKYRELVENTNSIILRMDKSGKVTFFNEFAQSFFGFSAEEITGNNVIGTIVPKKDTSGKDLGEMILEIGRHPEKFRNNTNENMRKDGELVWIAWTNKPIFDNSGQIAEIMCVGNDITDRVKAEKELEKYRSSLEELVEERTEELRESEELSRLLFDNSLAFIVAICSDGKTIMMNKAMLNALEYSEEEVKGADYMATFVPEENREMLAGVFQEIIREGKSVVVENLIMSKSGRRYFVEWHGCPVVKTEKEKTCFLGVGIDITERKQVEKEKAKLEGQNRQLQKAESLGRMSGAIAHHFNNQLQVVMGYLGMVIGDLPPGDSRAVKLTTAMQAAKKASEVSGLLLAYLGQKQVKLELIDLAEQCRIGLPILQAGKPEDVALEIDLPSPGPSIRADAKQLQQILNNLIINAWEAIGDGAGTIRLSVRTASPADIPASRRRPVQWRSQEQNYACLEVMDSGCGIQENDMDKLFDPFFSTKFTGRGLGLSVVLGIVRAHDAVITAESRIKGGSVFKVFFPLSAQIAPRQNEEVARVPKLVLGGTVLLVEDEEALREMTKIALVSFGFTVLKAKDGVEAVEIFGQHKDEISCLLCDLTMPRMSGWATISALRAIRHDLPVVLSSGYDEASVMAGEHPELPDFFLNKPYDLNKLCDTIAQAMARRHLADPI